jgi:hypothetical protein
VAIAYPWATQTPAVARLEPDVTAFRVNEDGTFFGLLSIASGTSVPQEIKRESGDIPAHSDLDFFYGFFIFPATGYNIHAHSLRLYRRGYETIVIEARPWIMSLVPGADTHLAWKQAESLEAREEAIAAIYRPKELHIGSRLPKNEFIAEEYRLLAESPVAAGPENAETRKRLRELAKSIKEGHDE